MLKGLKISSKLQSPELEEEFRLDSLKRDTRKLTISILLALIPITIFMINDFLTFGNIDLFEEIIICRILMTIWSLAVIYIIRNTRNISRIDTVMLVWMLGATLLTLIISYSRPDDYIPAVVLNMVYVMAIYTMFPVPLYLHLTTGILISFGEFILITTIKDMPIIPGGIIMLIMGFVLANLFGAMASFDLNKSRRRQFILLKNELEIKSNLQYALSEVKSLRGIIPICYSCRKIRNDEGYYEVVELYLKRHSDVDFSHTLCPECLTQQMQALNDEFSDESRNASTEE